MSSLIRCTIALHNLVNNKIKYKESEEVGFTEKKDEKKDEKKESAATDLTKAIPLANSKPAAASPTSIPQSTFNSTQAHTRAHACPFGSSCQLREHACMLNKP